MKNNNIHYYTLLTVFAMAAVAMSRLLPHPLNFTPVAAIALYGGTRGKNIGFSFMLPLLIMAFSDILVMQFIYPERGNPFAYFITKDALSVYLSFSLIVGIGLLLKNNIKVSTVIVSSLASSLLFYLITNFFSWYGAPYYPQNFDGLMLSYTAGLPFTKLYQNQFLVNQFVGDFFFTAVLFGVHAFATKNIKSLAQA